MVPVHKKNEKNVKGNYPPISLLPIFGKILEKLVYDSLYSHLVSHDLLNPNQSSFRPGDSTVNQLISITHPIYKAFDCNSPPDVCSVYLDISKAFDRVWHDGLIHKLKRCGVSGKLHSLLQSFLMDRKQRTILNGQCSSWGDISAGVPQGSILGPLFFLVHINDLTENLKCNIKLFADDTLLFTVVENSNAAANDMNHDLELIMQWAHDWRMSFNPNPQKQAVKLIFSTKKTEVVHPVICFNNVPVKIVNEHKHLGIVLDSKQALSSRVANEYFDCIRKIDHPDEVIVREWRITVCYIKKKKIRNESGGAAGPAGREVVGSNMVLFEAISNMKGRKSGLIDIKDKHSLPRSLEEFANIMDNNDL